jgi:hypothetical protein
MPLILEEEHLHLVDQCPRGHHSSLHGGRSGEDRSDHPQHGIPYKALTVYLKEYRRALYPGFGALEKNMSD